MGFSPCMRMRQDSGQVGEPKATIGETGDTGMIGENTLYELREGAEPVDPLHWLAKR